MSASDLVEACGWWPRVRRRSRAPSRAGCWSASYVNLPAADQANPGGRDGLTEGEVQLLDLVARRQSSAEIAAALVVTETTVRTHLHHQLSKLGLRHRVQLVVAYDTGLVQPRGR
jgi:DNA-binding NarL/FixJ family response regulator